jgi:hypothetical protein
MSIDPSPPRLVAQYDAEKFLDARVIRDPRPEPVGREKASDVAKPVIRRGTRRQAKSTVRQA